MERYGTLVESHIWSTILCHLSYWNCLLYGICDRLLKRSQIAVLHKLSILLQIHADENGW